MSKNDDVQFKPILGLTIPQLKDFIKLRIDKNFKSGRLNKADLIKYIKDNFEPIESDFLKAALSGTRDDYEFIKVHNRFIDPYIAVIIIQNAAASYYDNVGPDGKEIIRYIVNTFKNDISVLESALYALARSVSHGATNIIQVYASISRLKLMINTDLLHLCFEDGVEGNLSFLMNDKF